MTSWNLFWQILHTETWQFGCYIIFAFLIRSRHCVKLSVFDNLGTLPCMMTQALEMVLANHPA
jgi:hypothetical protein